MLRNSPFYASLAVDDLSKAVGFYRDTLGVDVIELDNGLAALRAGNGYAVLIYAKDGHVPAEHTVVNFPVDDIEATVDGLREARVEFEQYDEGPLKTDEKGIATPGPKQAWFPGPGRQHLSVIEEP